MASTLQGTIEFLKDFGLFDVILPFILVFAIVFSILEKTSLLGKKKQNLNSLVAIVFALLVITANKVVTAITNALPNILLLIIILVSFLLMLGILFKEEELDFSSKMPGWYKFFVVLMFIGLIFIFLGAYILDSGVSILSYIFSYLYAGMGNDLVGGIILIAILVGVIYFASKSSKGDS
jgi:hypothetical protein